MHRPAHQGRFRASENETKRGNHPPSLSCVRSEKQTIFIDESGMILDVQKRNIYII